MRLLFTIPDFWPHVRRGSERLVHDLATELGRRNHHVTVVTRTPEPRGTTDRSEGFEVRYRPSRSIRTIGDEEDRWRALEAFSRTATVAGLVHPADLFHAFYLSDAYGLSRAARVRKRPLVISFHGRPWREWWESRLPRTHRMFMTAVERAAAVTVLSRDSAQRFQEDYGIEPHVVMPGIFTADFDLPRVAGPRTIVCAAALDVGRKRIDVLLDAFEMVATDAADVELLLVGPGDPSSVMTRVDAMPADVRRRAHVEFLPTAQLPAVYARCTVGALTSEDEAFGLVLVEYMAAGMPVVGTDDSAIPEVITPETGFVFAKGDAVACAEALTRALRLADAPTTVERCRARAAEFDWSRRADVYENLYAEVTSSKRVPGR